MAVFIRCIGRDPAAAALGLKAMPGRQGHAVHSFPCPPLMRPTPRDGKGHRKSAVSHRKRYPRKQERMPRNAIILVQIHSKGDPVRPTIFAKIIQLMAPLVCFCLAYGCTGGCKPLPRALHPWPGPKWCGKRHSQQNKRYARSHVQGSWLSEKYDRHLCVFSAQTQPPQKKSTHFLWNHRRLALPQSAQGRR